MQVLDLLGSGFSQNSKRRSVLWAKKGSMWKLTGVSRRRKAFRGEEERSKAVGHCSTLQALAVEFSAVSGRSPEEGPPLHTPQGSFRAGVSATPAR